VLARTSSNLAVMRQSFVGSRELRALELAAMSFTRLCVNRSRGTSTAAIHYEAMVSEDTENFACTVTRSKARELVEALQLLPVTIYKCSINPITNINPVASH
jgi:hypothetical protein